jgi:Retinoic acid induced 16-like protein
MNFCYEQSVFIALSKIGQAGSPSVIRECITTFSMFIEEEDEQFLAQKEFGESLIEFLRKASHRNDHSFEGEFVELLFSIAQKIRLSRGILRAWFTTRSDESGGRDYDNLGPQQKFAGITNKVRSRLQLIRLGYSIPGGCTWTRLMF